MALTFLVQLLVEVAALAEHNLMTESNLGIVFGPNILPAEVTMQNLGAANNLIQVLIINHEAIFADKERKPVIEEVEPHRPTEEAVVEPEKASRGAIAAREQPVVAEVPVVREEPKKVEVEEPAPRAREEPKAEPPKIDEEAAQAPEVRREAEPAQEEPAQPAQLEEPKVVAVPEIREPEVTFVVPDIQVEEEEAPEVQSAPAKSQEEEENPEQFHAAKEAATRIFGDSVSAFEAFAQKEGSSK